MPGPDEFAVGQRLANPESVLPATAAGTPAPAPPPPATFTGTTCKMGDTVPCMCTDGASAGVHVCRAEPLSPTGGALKTECERCVAPAPVPPPAAGMAGSAVATSGAGGSSGSASGGTGGMSAGSGGAGSAGAGSGGSAGSMMMPMCDADDCPGTTGLFGIEREPCCTRRGECGGINGLSGACETD